MNWYNKYIFAGRLKVSSITFSLEDAWKIAQPKTILDLCSDFINFVHYKAKMTNDQFRPYSTDCQPDGTTEFDGFTGTMNLYIREGDEPSEYVKAMEAWKRDKAVEGYKIEYNPQPEQSGMMKSKVFRIQVLENPSQNLPQIPEANLANGNAYAILRLLGIEPDHSGSMDLMWAKKRIEEISQEEMETEARDSGYLKPGLNLDLGTGEVDADPADAWKGESHVTDQPLPPPGGQPKGPMMFMGGRDMEYIDNRLQELYKIVDYGLSNGFKKLQWA